MLIKHEDLFKKECLAFVFQVYKPLFEAVSDSSGGKTLEDVFYEREVWWKWKCSQHLHPFSHTLGFSFCIFLTPWVFFTVDQAN